MVENAEKILSDLATLSARVLLDLAEKPVKMVKNLRLFLVIENHYVYITARPLRGSVTHIKMLKALRIKVAEQLF